MSAELEIMRDLAESLVAAGVLIVGVLHGARFVLRLTKWLVTEIREQLQLLLEELRSDEPPR